MEFNEVIRTRRAVRSYKTEPVPEQKVQALREALQAAPSGNNRQPFRFVFVTDPALRNRIAKEACHQDFIQNAPLLAVACCEKGDSFNAAIAVDHMVLAATSEGLGTCWIGWFERDAMRAILNIPDDMEIPIMITVGYKDGEPEKRPRKSLDELVGTNRY